MFDGFLNTPLNCGITDYYGCANNTICAQFFYCLLQDLLSRYSYFQKFTFTLEVFFVGNAFKLYILYMLLLAS